MSFTTNATPPATPKKKPTVIVVQSPYFSPRNGQSKDGKFSVLNPSDTIAPEPPSRLEIELETHNNFVSTGADSPPLGKIQMTHESYDLSHTVDPIRAREMLGPLKPNLIQGIFNLSSMFVLS